VHSAVSAGQALSNGFKGLAICGRSFQVSSAAALEAKKMITVNTTHGIPG
jgi:hypothetical protein